uniref:Variant surface glycoprotein (VSG, atypical) n=2 Tax=Trypanosoma brucei TaxID=5691 RepID=B3GVN5_TRYBB|nr:variant surface glycoprotein (VSG, atypical) [Trypanosoma brucei brucei]
MTMCKKLLGFIVGVASMMMITPVSSVEEEIVNEGEFKTLCDFVSLTQRINESLRGMEEKSGVSVSFLQKKVTDVLFGTGIGDVSKMKWQPHRDMDCGSNTGNRAFWAGEALMKDLLCLCERTDGLHSSPEHLCYRGRTKRHNADNWQSPTNRKNTWNELQNKCKKGGIEGAPTRTEFQDMRKQLEAGIKKRNDSQHGEYCIYGGEKAKTLRICDGRRTETNGICVLYPRGPDGDNASGIEWLNKLERLVKNVEKINQSNHGDMDAEEDTNNTNSNTGTGENSPAERSHESRENDETQNTQATTTSETQTGLITARPPEEQKSSVKIILQFVWVFLFLLFV